MRQYLVIDKREGSSYIPYKDQYKVFNDNTMAMDHAKKIGFSTMLTKAEDLAISNVGMLHMSSVGSGYVGILIVEAISAT